MVNWKTTLSGFVTGFPIAIDALVTAYQSGMFDEKSGMQLMLGIGLVLIGAYSKDHNVTHSDTLQTRRKLRF